VKHKGGNIYDIYYIFYLGINFLFMYRLTYIGKKVDFYKDKVYIKDLNNTLNLILVRIIDER